MFDGVSSTSAITKGRTAREGGDSDTWIGVEPRGAIAPVTGLGSFE